MENKEKKDKEIEVQIPTGVATYFIIFHLLELCSIVLLFLYDWKVGLPIAILALLGNSMIMLISVKIGELKLMLDKKDGKNGK